MGFISDLLEEHEFQRTFLKKDWIFLSGDEYLFLTLRKGAEVGEHDSIFSFSGTIHGSECRRELSFSSIYHDHIGEIILFDTFEGTPVEDFSDGCEVIDHPGLEGLDLVFAISGSLALSIHDNRSGGHSELTVGVGYIIALEYDFS